MKTFKQFNEEGEAAPTNTTNAFTQSEKENPPAGRTKHNYKKKNEKSAGLTVTQVNNMRKVVGGVNV